MFLYKPIWHDSRVLGEASALAGAGYDVMVIASHTGPTTATSSGGLRVLTVNKSPRSGWLLWGVIERARARAGETESRPARALGGATVRIALATYGSLAWWRYFFGALRVAAHERADLYVAHDLETLPVAVAAKAMSGGRIVYDSHELYTELPTIQALARRRWSAIERALIGRADRVMTVSETLARALHDRYGIDLPCVLMNVPHQEPIPDAPARNLRAELEIPDAAPLILHLGYLQPDRGIEQVISSMSSCPEAVLVLMGAGEGDYVSSLKQLVARLELSARVRFVPLVPPDQVVANARAADLGVVLPSTSASLISGRCRTSCFSILPPAYRSSPATFRS